MFEVITLLAGMFLGFIMGRREVKHTIKVDARDAIQQPKEATNAVKELEKEIKW